ncbi:MAG TPA: transaldolase, partial [Thermoanaerobaculia bacterium]|nr:transaldolase [Thermoanaerobaculia bacterium]
MTRSLPDTDRVVVLGMGGSSLAPLVFADSFGRKPGFPRVEVLDSTEPSSVLAAGEGDLSRTLFIVSSKSGTTLEPNIFFDYFFARTEKALGGRAGERFIVVTDPGSALEKEAARRKVRRVFPGDPSIGGRYSALSYFGLVPAAFAGVDVGELLARGHAMAERCRAEGPENPGLALGAALGGLALEGRDKVTFAVGPPIGRFGMWTEQLIAESTGKEGKGILPVEGEP